MTTLYERYADEIAGLIRRQALRAGDRLPSVRQASASRGISPSTVFEAYYLLEARGLVEARSRSGYYVKAAAATLPPPGLARPGDATEVAISELVFQVLGSSGRPDMVPLGSAFPSPALFPLAALARHLGQGMRALPPQRLVQDLAPGNDDLRRQIVRRYGIDGTAVSAEEIVMTNGAMEALGLCLQAVTRPGDVVAVESPTFYAALQALERLQLRALEVPTDAREGVDLDALAGLLDRHRVKACWFMPSFQNPLGALMPQAKRQALVDLLARHQVPLIEDDVYAELHADARKPVPAKAFDRAGLVMHCGSFSKCLAPGYRVGWVAAGRFAQRVERLRLMSSLSPALPSQQAVAAYLAEGGYDRHLRRLRRALSESRRAMLAAVRQHFPVGTRVHEPQGGYFLWVELPSSVDALELHRRARAQGIGLAPGPLFSPAAGFAHCIRLNHGHADDPRIDGAVQTLGALAWAMA
ncbi:MAG: PLP-dependent aminotransferase family protein [Pseudomonadota bacterium]|nr:PLP-dependent aminotransferase family protein [Pseudomonadota bacterium]